MALVLLVMYRECSLSRSLLRDLDRDLGIECTIVFLTFASRSCFLFQSLTNHIHVLYDTTELIELFSYAGRLPIFDELILLRLLILLLPQLITFPLA